MGTSGERLGVVIPTLEEEEALPTLLDDLAALRRPIEIVVSDGGSRDDTVKIARARGTRTVMAPQGRASQMNAGARALDTPWLLFLHADSRIPDGTAEALEVWLRHPPSCEAAHFAFRLDGIGPWWRILEAGQRARERFTGLAYGDQGLLLSRRRYDAIGGIPALPLMEDVEAVRSLRRSGGIDRISSPLVTSARRYRAEGFLLGPLRNTALILLFFLGMPSERLARWYRPHPGMVR